MGKERRERVCSLPDGVVCDLPESIARIEANLASGQRAFARIEQHIEHLDKKLIGNGGPGICTRLDRLEQRHTWEDRTSGHFIKVIVNVAGGVLTAAIIMAIVWFRSQQ